MKIKKEKWFHPKVEMGWKKTMPMRARRKVALDAHKGNILSTARALQSLANITTDKTTKKLARDDARYFFDKYNKNKRQV